MGEPNLYQRYDRHEATALFGSEAEARSLCDGQWVIFPKMAFCFTEVGQPPRVSHFRNGGEFCWVADKPYQVSDDKHVKFVPDEAFIIQGNDESKVRMLFDDPNLRRLVEA
jgi:hypothetical protein